MLVGRAISSQRNRPWPSSVAGNRVCKSPAKVRKIRYRIGDFLL